VMCKSVQLSKNASCWRPSFFEILIKQVELPEAYCETRPHDAEHNACVKHNPEYVNEKEQKKESIINTECSPADF
jgi:hypothetical protein